MNACTQEFREKTVAQNDDQEFDGIFFEIDLPKGYKTLPIESVASEESEQKILLSSPRYLIEDIEDCTSNCTGNLKVDAVITKLIHYKNGGDAGGFKPVCIPNTINP